MDILIRDVDPVYAKEIDKKAAEISKKLGRNFSRNEYIKMLIQNDSELRLLQLKEDKFDQVVTMLTSSFINQENKLQEFIDSNNRLFHLMATGADIEEGVEKL